MKLVKYQALGNDYLFINSAEEAFPEPGFTKQICHRNLGITSDGVLYGGMSDGKFEVVIINPDSSVAEISGNGVRIFARAMLDQGHVAIGDEFCVNTGSRQVMCKVASAGEISVDMRMPSFSASNLPAESALGQSIAVKGRKHTYYAVSMGNPHCVIFVDILVHEHGLDDGPILEDNPAFIEKTKVQFAKIIDKNNIEIEIWKRGTGYTLASRSSFCGVFAATRMLGKCTSEVGRPREIIG